MSAVLFGLLACGAAGKLYDGLPPRTDVAGVLVHEDRVLVVGAVASKAERYAPEGGSARIFLFPRGPATVVWQAETGWIQAAHQRGLEVWAAWARLRPEGQGSLYELIVSHDGGATWIQRGPIPATSVVSLAIVNDRVGWSYGANNLWRTEDGGATWAQVTAPSAHLAPWWSIVPDGEQGAWLMGPTLLRTDDAGARWRPIAEQVDVTDGRYALGKVEGGVRVGRLEGDGVRWLSTWTGAGIPRHISSDGARVVALMSSSGDEVAQGPILLQSDDGGATLTHRRLIAPLDAAYWALNGTDELIYVDQGRALRARSIVW